MLVMSCLTGLADLFRRTASPPPQRRAAPLVSSPHPLAPTAAWPGRASEGRAACCSRGGFRARWHSAKPLAHLSVSFSGWNEGSVGWTGSIERTRPFCSSRSLQLLGNDDALVLARRNPTPLRVCSFGLGTICPACQRMRRSGTFG